VRAFNGLNTKFYATSELLLFILPIAEQEVGKIKQRK
jgi:hypothetical protein